MSVTDGTLYPISSEKVSDVVARAKDWALSHGLLMRTVAARDSSETVNYASFTLFPLRLSQNVFNQAMAIQPHFNLLMHRVAHDRQFLYDSLKQTMETDDFVRNLWDVYVKSYECPHTQPISLLLSRSDYMLDAKHQPASLKQIEFNTIASSFSGLMGSLPPLQRFIMDINGVTYNNDQIPDTRGAEGTADGLFQSWELYARPQSVVLMVVEMGVRNIIDQRWIEWRLIEKNKRVSMIRRSFAELRQSATVDAEGRLFVDDKEVAVVYYRTGYMPNDYSSQKDWELRSLIECSQAIKCPTIHSQLSGCKKIQQVLAMPGNLEKFIQEPDVVAELRKTFAGLYPLDLTCEGDAAVSMAMQSEHFVMKPQREGGGNNIYGKEVGTMLKTLGRSSERSQYILMDRIYPEEQNNVVVMANQATTVAPTISELGIFGILIGSDGRALDWPFGGCDDGEKVVFGGLHIESIQSKLVDCFANCFWNFLELTLPVDWNRSKVYENCQCGYLVRTKHRGTDEGSVLGGCGGISALFIV